MMDELDKKIFKDCVLYSYMLGAIFDQLQKTHGNDVSVILWLHECCGISFERIKKSRFFDEEDVDMAIFCSEERNDG